MAKKDKGKKDKKDKKGKGKDKGKGKQVAAPVPAPEPEKPVPKYDPCRYVPESCSEDLGCRPNSYPGLLECPEPMAIVGSESGTYESLCKLLQGGFRCANRIFMMTPWGNYVLFRVQGSNRTVFFIFDGCTCNVNRFRYYDLNIGTAGLLFYKSTHEILHYIMNSKLKKEQYNRLQKNAVDEIVREYCCEFCSPSAMKTC